MVQAPCHPLGAKAQKNAESTGWILNQAMEILPSKKG